jgi:hypothetical protein
VSITPAGQSVFDGTFYHIGRVVDQEQGCQASFAGHCIKPIYGMILKMVNSAATIANAVIIAASHARADMLVYIDLSSRSRNRSLHWAEIANRCD